VHADAALAGLPLGLLAYAEGDPLQLDAGQRRTGRPGVRAGQPPRGQEDLADAGHRGQRAGAEPCGPHRKLPPAEHLRAFDQGIFLEYGHRPGLVDRPGAGQEDQAGGVFAGRRQGEVDDVAVEGVRHLEHDPGPVAGGRLGTPRAAVVEPAQRGQPFHHNLMGPTTMDIGDERDATRVVLVCRVVKPLRVRLSHRAS
jgi:hypothetical protein